MLPLLLDAFHAAHPDITVQAGEVWWGDSAVADGLVQVSITRSRPTVPDENVLWVPIIYTPLGLVLGADHPAAQGEKVRIADLRREALKVPPRAFSPHFYDMIVSSLRLAGFGGTIEELAIFGSGILAGDPEAQADVVAHRAVGFGFRNQYNGLEPALVWREVEPEIPIPMHLCWRRDASPAARNFLAVVLDTAQEQGWIGEAAHAEADRLLIGSS
jgi:DNA-binding transcriptional LysR family regulator